MKYKIILLLMINILNVNAGCRTEAEIPSTTPNSRFTDNGNGTVSDIVTGLMWQQCQLGLSGVGCASGSTTIKYDFQNALDLAVSNTFAGYNDWRVPSHKELLSIVEQRCNSPSINSDYFPKTSSDGYWTSSPSANMVNSPNVAWIVFFSHGNSYGSSYRGLSSYVRLVRYVQ